MATTKDQPRADKVASPEQVQVDTEVYEFIVKLRGKHPGLIIGYTLTVDPANVVKHKSQHNTRPLGN